MSDKKPEDQAQEPEAEQAAAQEPAVEQPTAEPESESAASETAEAALDLSPDAARVIALEEEVGQLKDQLLRALAEAENVRRRAQREKADTQKYAAAPLLRDLLPVADNLTRAIQSVPADAQIEDDRFKTLLAGIELTQKELDQAFQRHNVTKLDPLGETLDPHRHEAMFEVPDPSKPNGTVVQVVEPGYLLHDRLIRPARVGVAKGGAPAAQATAAQTTGAQTAGSQNAEAPAEEPQADAPQTDEAGDQPGSRVDTSA